MQDMLDTEEVKDVVRSGKYDLINGQGLLHCAARHGNIQALELFLAAAAPLDALDGHGLTALQVLYLTTFPAHSSSKPSPSRTEVSDSDALLTLTCRNQCCVHSVIADQAVLHLFFQQMI